MVFEIQQKSIPWLNGYLIELGATLERITSQQSDFDTTFNRIKCR